MEDIDIIEQLTPGTIDGLGIVLITEKESTIPHFDIIRSDNSKVSIMILDNRYMDYTESVLTNEECRLLDEWSKGKEKKEWYNSGWYNWNNVLICWDGLYNGYEVEYDDHENILKYVPDYTIIKPYKE